MSPIVGIDARKLRDGGIGRYLRGLLRGLAALDGDERYVVFLAPDDAARADEAIGAVLPPARFTTVPCAAGRYSIAEILAFRGLSRRHALDVLHFPHYVRGIATCPVCVTIHDAIHLSHPPSAAARAYARAMLSWSARSAARLFAPSAAARDDVARRLRVDPSRFAVTPNGIDAVFAPQSPEARAAVRASRGLECEYILCVGTHRPHKNVPAAIRAFRAAALPGVELVLTAAEGRAAAALEALAGAGVRVFTGVGDAELAALLGAARFVLAPSLAEGFGLGPLEAMACGAPVLASDIPAHREVLAGAAAWFDPGAPVAALAAELRRLHADDAARRALAARGPDRAREFPWSRTARLTRDGYRAALPARSSTRS